MKVLIVFLFFITSLTTNAQTQQPASVKTTGDTLILSTPSLPAAVKFGNDIYQFKKIIPGQKTFNLDLTEPAMSALFQLLDLSNGSHYEVEQIKTLLREQLKPQLSSR